MAIARPSGLPDNEPMFRSGGPAMTNPDNPFTIDTESDGVVACYEFTWGTLDCNYVGKIPLECLATPEAISTYVIHSHYELYKHHSGFDGSYYTGRGGVDFLINGKPWSCTGPQFKKMCTG